MLVCDAVRWESVMLREKVADVVMDDVCARERVALISSLVVISRLPVMSVDCDRLSDTVSQWQAV